MPEGGKIRISVYRYPEYSLLIVEDNGYGMDAGSQEQIFNPVFTTKIKTGTGLRLAAVQEIVQ